jgi:Tfp pilus assembly protein PilF
VSDIFAIQEDIAEAIAAALRVPLGLAQGERLVSNRTSNLESYQQYLRARALFRARDIEQAIRVLEPVVAREPNYAPAWGLLSRAYRLSPNYSPITQTATVEEVRRAQQAADDKAGRAAREAVRLDPKHPLAYLSLAHAEADQGRKTAGEDLFRQALALDPNDPEVLDSYRQFLISHGGRIREALSVSEQVRTLEPFVPIYNVVTADIMRSNGQVREAIAILEAIPQQSTAADRAGNWDFARNVTLAEASAADGRYVEAADTLLLTKTDNQAIQRSLEDAARLLRTAPTKATAPNALPELRGQLEFVYLYVGASDRVFENHERRLEILPGDATLGRFWAPEYAPLRNAERFKALAKRAGYVDYWRARGWPDLCRPMGENDFVCD